MVYDNVNKHSCCHTYLCLHNYGKVQRVIVIFYVDLNKWKVYLMIAHILACNLLSLIAKLTHNLFSLMGKLLVASHEQK